MAWPCRRELWGGRLDEARATYAAIARAIARFEPVMMLARIGAEFPGREVVAVDGAILAEGGGGVHCITQQIPL